MQIQVDRIPAEGKRFFCEEQAADYAIAYQDFVFNDPVFIDIRAQVVTGNLIVSGAVETKFRVTCSRCLTEFTQSIRNTDFNFDCPVTSENEIIDLTAPVREDIIINLPAKPLCKSDCKGLCPACGRDRNKAACSCEVGKTDIRWAELENLKLKPKREGKRS